MIYYSVTLELDEYAHCIFSICFALPFKVLIAATVMVSLQLLIFLEIAGLKFSDS